MRRSRDGVPTQRSSGRHMSSSYEIDWIAEERGVLHRPSEHFSGDEERERTAECLSHKTGNSAKRRNTWSQEEDDILIKMVGLHSSKKWPIIARAIPGRSRRQCRERWAFYLDPAVNNQPWSEREDVALIRAHQIHGNDWCELAKLFPGRTGKAIKNHWSRLTRRKLNSDLVRGLSEEFPCMPNDPFIIKNKGSSIIKSAQESSINVKVSVDSPIPKTEQGLTENDRNSSSLKETSSDSMHSERSVAHSINVSEKVGVQVDRSSCNVVTKEKVVLSSSSVDQKVSFAAASFPTSLRNEESANSLKASFNNVNIGFSPAHDDHASIHDRSDDTCSSADLESQELHLANIADLLDMPYCESLMIVPPGSPNDGSSIEGTGH